MSFSLRDEDPFPGYSRPNGFSPGYIQNPHDVREVILRDLEEERKRIREELLVASKAHKQMMEAGLRIELSLERQMAIVRGDHFPFVSGSTMNRSSTMVNCGARSVKDRLGPRRCIREYENFPLIRDSEPTFLEMNPTSEFSNKKVEVTFPSETQKVSSGAKRKAEAPPPEVSGVYDIPSAAAKKNRTKEWSFAVCKLNFSNVQMLNDHVQGREHLGYHLFEQNADESKKKIEKESTLQATLNIHDSRKENVNSTAQVLKLTKNSKKFMTLSEGVDRESVMNDNRSREKISGEFVEVAQNGGVYVDKARSHKKETNTSFEMAVTNDIYNMEQAKPQKHVSGSKQKDETQPLEAVGAKKNPKQEFSCRSCGLFKVIFSNDQKNEHMQGMKHKAAERRERFGTGLLSKDSNNRVKTLKAICNRNSNQVIQDSEELKKVNVEKNELAEAAKQTINNSKKINGNPAVQMLKPANNNEKFMAPSTSQNDRSQVSKTFNAEQEVVSDPKKNIFGTKPGRVSAMLSATKDKEIQKLEQAKLQGNVSGFKHKADTQPLEVVDASKIPSAGAKKKLKQEFSCALCHVSVSTEITFNQHIQGKRHKKAAEIQKMLVIGSVPKDNNSLANIAEKNIKSKLVQVYKSEAEISPRIVSTHPKSVKNDEVVQKSQEFKKKNELAEGVTRNIDYSKKENGNLAVQLLKLGTNNEKFMASSTLLEVEPENKKKVDAHKRRQDHSVEFRGVAQNGGSQVEKAFSEEEETTKISSGIVGIEDKDSHKLVQAMLQGIASGPKRKVDPKTPPAEVGGASKIPSVGAKKKLKQVITCGHCCVVVPDENIFNEHNQGMRHKANIEAQRHEWSTNADDSSKETGKIIELACEVTENIDNPKVEKGISALEIVKLTSSTEKLDPVSTVCKLEGNLHSGKLLEVAHIGGFQAKKASTAKQETYKVSANTEATKDDPSLEQGKVELHSREFLVVGSNCGSQTEKATSVDSKTNSVTNNNDDSVQNADATEQEDKGESESQRIQNTCKSDKETNNLTEKTLKIEDRKKRFKFMCRICKVGSNTERVMIAHNNKQSHLEKLRVEKAVDGVPENVKENNG